MSIGIGQVGPGGTTSGGGTSGYSGVSGYSGFSGANPGASGYSGYSGLSGYSGYSGVGTSGYSGYSGVGSSGYSGYSGTGGGITNSAGNNVLMKSDGTNAVASTWSDTGTATTMTVAQNAGTTLTVNNGDAGSSVYAAIELNGNNVADHNTTLYDFSSNYTGVAAWTGKTVLANIRTGGGGIALDTRNAGPIEFYTNSTGGTPRMAIDSAGHIFMNDLNTDATKTDATLCRDTTSKEIYSGTGAAGICLGTSSARFKEQISGIKEGLNEVLQLIPRNFRYKEGVVDSGQRLQYGFVAEEVEQIAPNIVAHAADGTPNSVDYGALFPVYARAIQELYEKFDAKIELLNDRLNALCQT